MIGLLSAEVGAFIMFVITTLAFILGVYESDNEALTLFAILFVGVVILAVFYIVFSIILFGVVL